MPDKRRSLSDAIATIQDGSCVALGGNTLHRAPAAAVHELVRQGKRGLELVEAAGADDVDLLCGTGCATAVSAGFVGYENVFGLAPLYRRAVESGRVEAREHACYTIIAGLRAAAQGVPFMPVNGLQGSDLPRARDFRSVRDPYSNREVVAVRAIVVPHTARGRDPFQFHVTEHELGAGDGERAEVRLVQVRGLQDDPFGRQLRGEEGGLRGARGRREAVEVEDAHQIMVLHPGRQRHGIDCAPSVR